LISDLLKHWKDEDSAKKSPEEGSVSRAPVCFTFYRLRRSCEIMQSDVYEKAMQGNGDAQLEVGIAFYENVDHEKAFEFFTMAAKNGNAEAMNKLGYMLYKGISCKKDHELARVHWENGARLGSQKAASNLRLSFIRPRLTATLT